MLKTFPVGALDNSSEGGCHVYDRMDAAWSRNLDLQL